MPVTSAIIIAQSAAYLTADISEEAAVEIEADPISFNETMVAAGLLSAWLNS